jgi:hypothetical protein
VREFARRRVGFEHRRYRGVPTGNELKVVPTTPPNFSVSL